MEYTHTTHLTFQTYRARLMTGTAHFLQNTATSLALAGMLLGTTPGLSYALDANTVPSGENVVGGSASFDRPSAGALDVTQHSDRVIIEWDRFDIGSGASTEFFQPGSNSLAVNRVVTGQDPTQILGSLKSNGRIMILDANGVYFGANAQIDVGGIIASTGNIDDAAVMAGGNTITLSGVDGLGEIVNDGSISAKTSGLVALVAPRVVNNGVIAAQLGRVELAAGDKVTVDLYGDNLVEIAVEDSVTDALLENNGTISASGGIVALTTNQAKGIVDSVINMDGIIEANAINSSPSSHGGVIVLRSSDDGIVDISGSITANAKTNGNGGSIVIDSEGKVDVSGELRAEADKGNGGTVEIYAADQLVFDGLASTYSQRGQSGKVFIDPADMVIGNVADTPDQSFLSISSLQSLMSFSSLVDLQADDSITIIDEVDVSDNIFFGGKTTADLVFMTDTFNLDHNLIIGTGNVEIQANTANLTGRFFGDDGVTVTQLDGGRLSGTTTWTNVMGNTASIQQGIDVSANGGIVAVEGDVYHENITLDKSVFLIGDAGDLNEPGTRFEMGEITVVDGEIVFPDNTNPDAPEIHGTVVGGDVITVTADFAQIKGLKVMGSVDGGGNSANGIVVSNADNVDIRNSDFAGFDNDAINATNSDNLDILKNRITATQHNGVTVDLSDDVTVSGNVIGSADLISILVNGEMPVEGIGNDGIAISNGLNATVTGNAFDAVGSIGAGRDGVNFDNVTGGTISGNRASGFIGQGVKRDAIHVENSSNIDILNNRNTAVFIAAGAGRHGVYVNNSDNILIDNNTSQGVFIAWGVKRDLVHVVDSNNVGIYNNHARGTFIATGAGRNLIRVSGSDDITIEDNAATAGIWGSGTRAIDIYLDSNTNVAIGSNDVDGITVIDPAPALATVTPDVPEAPLQTSTPQSKKTGFSKANKGGSKTTTVVGDGASSENEEE